MLQSGRIALIIILSLSPQKSKPSKSLISHCRRLTSNRHHPVFVRHDHHHHHRRQRAVAQEESHSTPALLTTGGPNVGNSAISLGIIPEHSLLESCARLSVSLEGPGIFQGVGGKSSCSGSSHSSSSTTTRSGSQHHMTLDELRAVNRYAESTKSLSYLPQVRVMY